MSASTFPRWAGDAIPAFVYHLAQDLGNLGWEVEVLAPHAPGAATSEMMEHAAELLAYGTAVVLEDLE